MNILYISAKKNWGGVVSWMVKTAQGLSKKGHNVMILSAKKSKFTAEAPKDLNIIPWSFGFDYNPKTIIYIIYLIKKHKIDIVVTNIEKEIAAGGIAAKFCGIKNIRRVGRHDDFNDSKKKIRFRHEKFVDLCIIPCEEIFNEAVKHSPWLKKEQFNVIYNGRNPAVFDKEETENIRKNWKVNENDIVIGITSQLTKVKNIDTLIRSFDILNKEFNNLKLVIAGDGKEKENLKNSVKELELEDKVIFHGFTNQPQLIAAAYDIGVLVSLNEGFPNTVVEYMSVGTPVVATDVGGVKEIIKNGENGLITDNSPGTIAETVKKLIINENLRKELGKKAFDTVKENFTEDIMINNLEKFLKNAV